MNTDMLWNFILEENFLPKNQFIIRMVIVLIIDLIIWSYGLLNNQMDKELLTKSNGLKKY